jgi:hypothetical protein
MDKPIKKGVLDKTDSGQPILVNGKGKSYKVTGSIADIWNRLDGTKTVKEIVDDIPKTKSINPSNLENAINDIVSKFKEYDLAK